MLKFKLFIESKDDDYMYHATNHYNVYDILKSGKLKTYKPNYGTDQNSWPDGSIKKRSYWHPDQEVVQSFHPSEGTPMVLRIKKSQHAFKKESGSNDHYLEKSIGLDNLEINHNNEWKSIKELNY